MEDWLEFTKTLGNFYNYSISLKENEHYYKQLDYKGIISAKRSIVDALSKIECSKYEAVEKFFNFCMEILIQESHSFYLDYHLYENVLQSYIFVSLLNYIHDTKRISAISYAEYVDLTFDNEEISFERNKSKNRKYSPYKIAAIDTMRQQDSRLYKKRLFVKSKNLRYAAIRKDMEHERLLFYKTKNLNEVEQSTFKRLHYLYNDIYSITDNRGAGNIDEAFEKFRSKLSKLKYENIIELYRRFIEHINLDKEYYAFNLYRLEKELRVYNLSFEIKQLLSCSNDSLEDELLLKFYLLKDIEFPNVYKCLFSFEDIEKLMQYSNYYRFYKENIVFISNIILDGCIENGLLGEDWHKTILDIINQKTEYVLYSPDNIQFNTSSEAQDAFEKILTDQALKEINLIKQYQNQNNNHFTYD